MASVSQGSSPKKLKHNQDALAEDLMLPASEATLESTDDVPMSSPKSSGPGSQNSDDPEDYNSDDSSYYYYDDDSSYNETSILQAQFDAVDLPTSVEAPLPWLDQAGQSKNPAATSSSTVPSQLNFHSDKEKKGDVEVWLHHPSESQINQAATSSSTALFQSSLQHPAESQENLAAMSSSILPGQSGSSKGDEEKDENDVLKKFRLFKRFDTVQDYSDHHFTHGDSKSKQAPQIWTKTIQQEWKILEKDLPDTIFVRVYEERMDLLRAVILGTPGTPYHDGLFFFDVFFPSDYPNVPPQVFYYSGGLRLNPNLYNCGKVCLSLLNTWHGKKDEQWTPGKSTVLQVLLSIQALVLNEKPFFNEPGYESMAGGREGEMRSQEYNENTFILSCKTMLYTLRRPPKHYEDFVVGHFLVHAHAILAACKAYINGAQVGSFFGETVQDVDKLAKGGSPRLKDEVSKILPRLVQAFSRNGAKDCEKFLPTQN